MPAYIACKASAHGRFQGVFLETLCGLVFNSLFLSCLWVDAKVESSFIPASEKENLVFLQRVAFYLYLVN